MTTGSSDHPIRLEPKEACPPSTALVVGFQGTALVLAPTVLNVAIAVRSAGLDDTYLTWSVFAALLISAAITALQAFQFRRFGAGYIVLTCPAALFIGIMVATVTSAGPSTSASLMVVCCVIQVALAGGCQTLRRIFTQVVTGTVTMLIAVSVLPIAFDSVQNLSAGSRYCQAWWSWGDSNPRPPQCDCGALPTELQPRADTSAYPNGAYGT